MVNAIDNSITETVTPYVLVPYAQSMAIGWSLHRLLYKHLRDVNLTTALNVSLPQVTGTHAVVDALV